MAKRAAQSTSPRRKVSAAEARTRRPAEVKARILEAARELFAQNGFEGATTRAIARRAGVKLPLLLYHFKSKDRLWQAVITDIMEPYVERLMSLKQEMQGRPAGDVLRATIAEIVLYYAHRPELQRLMTGEGHRKSRRFTWLCENYVDRLFASLRDLIVAGQKEGTVRMLAPDRLRYAIVGMAAVPFSMRYEYERLTGRKIFSESEKQATIEFVNSVVFR